MEQIGIIHPGAMGISIAASAQNSGHEVYWVSQGRSSQTQARAKQYGLVDLKTLEKLCQTCSIIVSVCPPHAAETVAQQVATHKFQGLFVDANAISPQRAVRISDRLAQSGASFVDGGIIGGPAWEPDATWLYLSGDEAARVADCFQDGPLQTAVMGDEIGKASALKMCFAAYTKGTTALLCAILGAAESLDVRQELEQQWSHNDADFAGTTQQRVRRVTAKAWRFTGEMDEIAATFETAGLPGGFHEAAAIIFSRLADFKGRETTPPLADVLTALVADGGQQDGI